MTLFRSGVPGRKSTMLRLSPWLIVGLAIILGLAVAALAVRNAQREKRQMSRNLVDRAGALIWALEAGTRTWMGMGEGSSNQLQSLLMETAKQPGISYMAVTDESGHILAHSDAAKIGGELHAAPAERVLDGTASDSLKWRVVATPDAGRAFEVFKVFSPLPGFRRGLWHGPWGMLGQGHMGMGRGMMGRGMMRRGLGQDQGRGMGQNMGVNDASESAASGNQAAGQATNQAGPQTTGTVGAASGGKLIIFVGLDMKPFEEALAEDDRNTAIITLLIGLLGLGGFVSLFWAHNYRLSRRLLQDTRAFASEVVGSLPVGLVTSDEHGALTHANAVAAAMLGQGRESLEGRPLGQLGALDWPSLITRLDAGESVLELERELKTAAGQATPVSLSASRIVNEEGLFLGHLFILRDLREVKRLEEQVRRNERLTALGNLAAGVAHEIRNPLSSIKGFATFLAGKLKDDGPGKAAATAMLQEADRLNRVVSELLEFARPSGMRFKSEDINDVIARAVRLAQTDADAKSVQVLFTRDAALPPLMADGERLTQVLLNLCLNAIQAMKSGGVLSISATHDPAAKQLAVRIADTGQGMAPGMLADIFNPYFTTKPSGTGLGLAIVHRIVEAHGGETKVESLPGTGTTFTLLLPLAQPA